jgi:uncharacterized protein YybS (DUF2232 family)
MIGVTIVATFVGVMSLLVGVPLFARTARDVTSGRAFVPWHIMASAAAVALGIAVLAGMVTTWAY